MHLRIFFGVILLLIWVHHSLHVLHVHKLRVRGSGVSDVALACLFLPLRFNVLVPFLHDIFVCVPNDEVVNHPRIALPEYLNPMRTCKTHVRTQTF